MIGFQGLTTITRGSGGEYGGDKGGGGEEDPNMLRSTGVRGIIMVRRRKTLGKAKAMVFCMGDGNIICGVEGLICWASNKGGGEDEIPSSNR